MATDELTEAFALLAGARALVEAGWVRGAMARDAAGNRVPAESEQAVQWCMSGALDRAAAQYSTGAKDYAYAVLQEVTWHESISTWNDMPRRTQAGVLAAFDDAIKTVAKNMELTRRTGDDHR